MTGAASPSLRAAGRGLLLFGRMIRFSHSVFALPFALAGVLFAYHSTGAPVRAATWVWVVVAMIGARTAAMAFNRIVDRGIDAMNPRTRNREIPRGVVAVRTAAFLTAFAAVVFVVAAAMLNPLCLALSPVALGLVFAYSYTKRFTWGSHLVLGLCLAVAPVGGWAAVAGRLDAEPFLLALAVLTWVAGFDVFYALQDEAFDRAHGLASIPARFGARRAIAAARALHVATVLALGALQPLLGLSWAYLAGVAAIATILVVEHGLVRADDLRRLDRAFFDMNGIISVLYFFTALGGVVL